MKLAVMKMPGHIPGGGFHYCLFPKALDETDALAFGAMGHILIEVSDVEGNRLLKQAAEALGHQIEIACLAEGKIRYDQEKKGE